MSPEEEDKFSRIIDNLTNKLHTAQAENRSLRAQVILLNERLDTYESY